MARFESAADADQYLRQTVNYWDGEPIYVERVSADWMARGYVLPLTNNSARVEWDIRDKRFNCYDFRLGYMNSSYNMAFYCSRVPVRGMAQGLADNNTVFMGQVNDPNYGRIHMQVGIAIREQGFADMLKGKYPNRAEVAAKLADPNVQSIALSPVIAIKRHPKLRNLHYLEYKGEEIAFSETIEFQLPREFEYLREIVAPTGICKQRA